jgi:hypothetical protein
MENHQSSYIAWSPNTAHICITATQQVEHSMDDMCKFVTRKPLTTFGGTVKIWFYVFLWKAFKFD